LAAIHNMFTLEQSHVGVLVVDDQSPFRDVICRLVTAARGLDLLAAADSGETAVAAVDELGPDMVIMDVAMPGIGGVGATQKIKSDRPRTVVVLVSATHPSELPPEVEGSADIVVWKSELRPELLEEIWFEHGSAPGETSSP
jgi:DNA-binding NarL/FixJ family response regulator